MKVLREKPDFVKLKKEGYMAVDMHLHSGHSPDCSTKIYDLVKKANKKGFGLAITDHNVISGVLEASQKDVFLIPAIEVTCEEGVHVLLYFESIDDLKKFFDKHLQKKILSKDLLKLVKKYDCMASAAHPYSAGCGLYSMRGHPESDFVEVLNGSIREGINKKAKSLNKLATAGTDSHFIDYVGDVVVCAKAKTVKGFLDAVRKGDVLIVGKEISFFKWISINIRKELSIWSRENKKVLIKRRLKQIGLR